MTEMAVESPIESPDDPHDFVPIDGRLSLGENIVFGFQHVIAMFGATVLGPLLMGFDPNVAILFSGVGTLLFFVFVGGKIPSYLGSSFSFIAAVGAATGYSGSGPNPHVAIASGGIVVAGVIYACVGLAVMKLGIGWLERLLPPVITGVIVAIIGLNLASVAVGDITHSAFDTVFGILVIFIVAICTVYLPRALARLPILIGGGLSYLLYFFSCNILHLSSPIDFSSVGRAAWVGLPVLTAPVFEPRAISLIAPVVLVLIASITRTNLDPYLGRAFLADGVASAIAGMGGGVGVTTYAENIGVMSLTRVYASSIFIFSGIFVIILSLSPKFGAVIHTMPLPLLGGLAFVLFGMIIAAGGRIWRDGNVDFTQPANAIPVGVGLVMGAGNLTIAAGPVVLGGIATATLTAVILYQLLARRPA